MEAGALDRRITIERYNETRDSFNNVTKNWATLATAWASKEDVSDTERLAAQAVSATLTTRFQIRWSPQVSDVNPKDRVVFNDQVYDIQAVKEIGRHEGLEISATELSD
jgi:SPP1 family predicted phage head-tail adaptor